MLILSRGPSVSLLSGITGGGGLFRISQKCSVHLALCSDSVDIFLSSLFLTSFVCLLLFPDIVLVIAYNFSMLRCPAAVSASVARALVNSFLSLLDFCYAQSWLFIYFVLFLDRVTDQTVHAATDKEDG